MRIELPPEYNEKEAKIRFLDEFEVLSKKDQTVLLNKIGISVDYFNNIRNDRIGKYHPSLPMLVKIAWATGKPVEYFLYGKAMPMFDVGDLINIPKIENVLNDNYELVFDENCHNCYYSNKWLKLITNDPSKLVCIINFGDSMESTLSDGDKCKVDTSKTQIIDGAIFAFHFANTRQIIIKRLFYELDKIKIVSDNKRYAPHLVNTQEIKIIGRIIMSKRLYIIPQ